MPAFSPEKPHFFQPLIPGFEDKFLIPVSFFKYLKGLECHEITLRSSGGKLWPIKLNGSQFTDGWKEFVQDHDLHIGNFVVFGHLGNLVFDFLVFDESACEREYPSPFPSVKKETENEEETEIQQENVPISTSSEEEETENEEETEIEQENDPIYARREEGKTENEAETESEQENVPIYASSGKKVGRKKKGEASSGEPKHPYPNYVIKLSRDSFKNGRLHFPGKFARENGLSCRSYSIILKDEESCCWNSKLKYWSVSKQFLISAGWRDFCIDHELKEGDSVMVELIKKGRVPVFQVHTLE